MLRISLAVTVAVATTLTAFVSSVTPASALAVKRCGTVSGPTAHVATLTFDHYGVIALNVECGFAKATVASVVKQHLHNSSTPVLAKAPSGWVCVAQEVDGHIAVAGHCQRGRKGALSWVGVGLHL